MKHYGLFLMLAAILLSSCTGLKRPSSNPATMGSNALCYRAELKTTPERNAALEQEIINRNLDCEAILAHDPLMGERRF